MARGNLLVNLFVAAARDAERSAKAQQRNIAREIREQERISLAHARAAERELRDDAKARRAEEKGKKERYLAKRLREVEERNRDLDRRFTELASLLAHTLNAGDSFGLHRLQPSWTEPNFDAAGLDQRESPPLLDAYLPNPPTGVSRFLPGVTQKHHSAVAAARAKHDYDMSAYRTREREREIRYDAARAAHEAKVRNLKAEHAQRTEEIRAFKAELAAGKVQAIIDYCTMVLAARRLPDGFPDRARLAFVPESKQLLVECDLPSIDVVPEIRETKYQKARDEISDVAMPQAKRKDLYRSVVAQLAIKTLHELFKADRGKHVETVVFNGYVDSIDRATGRPLRVCLVTARTTRDAFGSLNLRHIDAEMCLRGLNATLSRSPAELVPVRPVLELNMVDPRFVEEADVLSGLDQRPNLMNLSPQEFESLITNLFGKMGLETRLTQASRDGGVDCVAFDPRPILGGKVVIQAKRYKNTVGVSAVRDLFGTMQNEGASKGILVTTSGYGKAAFEFADGKPMELLSGSHLLFLLKEHANIDAKIVPPDDWRDPGPDD